jgi:hypothetical protein
VKALLPCRCFRSKFQNRWFLDRIATHILAFEGDSKVTWFEGNYEAYHEQRRKLLGDEADKPHRIKFRPVSHK